MLRTEAEKIMEDRFKEYPFLAAVAQAPDFAKKLSEILELTEANPELYGLFENEVLMVLSLYAPVSKLAVNIEKTTGLPPEKSRYIASLVETLVLEPVLDELRSYAYLWNEELKKNLDGGSTAEARPISSSTLSVEQGQEPPGVAPKPLTREDLMEALGKNNGLAATPLSPQNPVVPQPPRVEVTKTSPQVGYKPQP